jgi:hypothetical protein
MLCGVAFASAAAPAQPTDLPAIPEMARLAKVFAGDWNTVEIVQHSKPVPDGAGGQEQCTSGSPAAGRRCCLRAILLELSAASFSGSSGSGGIPVRSTIAF